MTTPSSTADVALREAAGLIVGTREFLLRSGLFDGEWYGRTYCHDDCTDTEALEHYLDVGAAMGNAPNQALDALVRKTLSPEQEVWLREVQTLESEVSFFHDSGLFDGAAYLAVNEDVARAGIDPLDHFCRHGWKELRNPGLGFDVWWYWSNYLDPSRESINPLLHYALVGVHAGYEPKPIGQGGSDGVAYREGHAVRRICLFAGYDRDGIVDDYVVTYLRELDRHADVYYLADCAMRPGELDKIAPYTKGAWAVRHGAYDFGSYSMLARDLVGWDTIANYDELMFVNDSCYLLHGLDEVFAKMDASRCDWWGMQLSKRNFKGDLDYDDLPGIDDVRTMLANEGDHGYINNLHISSYFVVYRKPVIIDQKFRATINAVVAQPAKSGVILKYEIGLSRNLNLHGYRFDTFVDRLYPFHPLYTNQHFDWVGRGFPLFKRLLLSDNPLNAPGLAGWKERIKTLVPDADVEMMERNLLRVADHDKLVRSFRIVEDESGQVVVPTLLDDGEFRKADATTPKFDHWWAFPVCAFDSTFAGNERAVFEEVRDDPSIKKIVLTRRKDIAIDGENVVVMPMNSPEGQYHLLRSGQIFVKHSPSVNVTFPLSPMLHNFINLWHGIPLKRFGYASMDMVDKLGWLRQENPRNRAVISSSKMDTLAMASAFYPLSYREIWPTGLPRNDFILRAESRLPDDLREEGRRLRTEVEGRRLVLFVPTFKNSQEDGYYRFDEEELEFLRDWLRRNNAVLGVREHMADQARTYSRMLWSLGILDLSSARYPNIEMLYREASLLITDYSSCAVDFMLTGKPVISFAYDYDHYANSERGLFYDLEHVFPGPVCRDFGQLASALETAFEELDDEAMEVREWKTQVFFDHRDDQGSWRVVDRVRRLYVKDIDDLPVMNGVENQ